MCAYMLVYTNMHVRVLTRRRRRLMRLVLCDHADHRGSKLHRACFSALSRARAAATIQSTLASWTWTQAHLGAETLRDPHSMCSWRITAPRSRSSAARTETPWCFRPRRLFASSLQRRFRNRGATKNNRSRSTSRMSFHDTLSDATMRIRSLCRPFFSHVCRLWSQ